jgi:integrase
MRRAGPFDFGRKAQQEVRAFGPRLVRLDTGEDLWILVDRSTDTPFVLPRRWIVRKRRNESSANALKVDMYGVGLLYEWGVARDPDFEARLAQGGQLTPTELDSLIDFVRQIPGEPGTHTRRLRSIGQFLKWTADPLDRGGTIYVPPAELQQYAQRIQANFEPYLKSQAPQRKEPLGSHGEGVLRALIGPVRGPAGRLFTPPRFANDNPFRRRSRVRNWLLYLLLRLLGLRVGEALTLKLEDCPTPGRPYFAIRRRPDDPDDPRRPRPQVKGTEGLVDSTPEIDMALRMYLADPKNPGRRVRGGSPFLLTASTGSPMLAASVDQMWKTAASARPFIFQGQDDEKLLTSHQMRHAWAEELARHLILEQAMPKEIAIDAIRKAGRWRDGSSAPFHYIQNAIAELGRRAGRARVDALPEETERE